MQTTGLLMRVLFFILLFIGFLSSCKSKKIIADGEVDTSLSTKKVIQNHYTNALNFKTVSAKVKIDYKADDTEQGVTVSLRMKKDEAIWISAPLGVFKAYITPKKVSFYNRLEGEYFDGDFAYISQLLGYEMAFEKVQNVLLGNTVLDLRDEKYVSTMAKESYFLRPKQPKALFKILFALEPQNFRVKRQQISQPDKNRLLKIDYAYQEVMSKIFPNAVHIEAVNEDGMRTIDLDFKNIEFDRDLNFPYKIPKGFKLMVAK